MQATRTKPLDFYNIDEFFTPEQRQIRDTVREFVDERVLPIIDDAWMEGRFPSEIVAELAALGVFGPTLPEEYGCAGLDNIAYGLIMQELERGDSGLRSFASVQGSLVMYPIYSFGSEEQRRRWLPALASGEKFGCFGLTEPDYGSNPAGMLTRARRKGDGWVLNGSKMWITNGSRADVAVVWAKTDDGDESSVRGFLVERGMRGFTARDQKGKHSLRASDTSELAFTDVELPADAILPKSGGLKSPLMCLTQARYGIAWGALGAAIACFEQALEYSKTREVFGAPLGAKQIQQERLAEMLTEITKGQLLAYHLGRLKDAGVATPQQVSLAKRNNVDIACDVARKCRRMLGANGILAEYNPMRHMANLESVYTYEGTHDVHALILGQALTGFNAF
ncbi:MAG: acyl-CoA dehydrogenase family protein [Candidatus Eremiobacteraeota bacterium]|nr:acyl-CoA dehydrogenase family protein [Candidatus Eremiobacteraeota bacterium]